MVYKAMCYSDLAVSGIHFFNKLQTFNTSANLLCEPLLCDSQNGWHRPLEGQDWILQVQGCTWLCSSSWLWLHDVWKEEVQLQEMWMWLSCLWEWYPLCLWMWKGFWGEPSGQNELVLLWWWKNLWGRPCDQKQLCYCDWGQAGEGWGGDSSWPWTFQPGEYLLNLLCECDST